MLCIILISNWSMECVYSIIGLPLLITLGEWMNTSAGLAFAPHVISVEAGEVKLSKKSFKSNGSVY